MNYYAPLRLSVCLFLGSLVTLTASGLADEPSTSDAPGSTSAVIVAQEQEHHALMARLQQKAHVMYSDLASFVCNEKIDRFKGDPNSDRTKQIDEITSRVSFENGEERYSEIFKDKKAFAHISDLGGAWSEGEFGTLLSQTRELLEKQPVEFRQDTDFNGVPAAIFSVDVTEHDSPWDLVVSNKTYTIPFRTYVWVSRSSAEILKIARVATNIPVQTRISKLSWMVTLRPTNLNGKVYLLPTGGQYLVQYEDVKRCEWNAISFSDYHRYGSEATLRFE